MSVQTQLTPVGYWWAIEVDGMERHTSLLRPKQRKRTKRAIERMVRKRTSGVSHIIVKPDGSIYEFKG